MSCILHYKIFVLNAILNGYLFSRFMKCEWIELTAYESWQSLVEYVEKVLREFEDQYVINFA